jgi:hypothetical protein
MPQIQHWFTDRYYLGFHRKVSNGICRYLIKISKGRITAEAIETAKEKIIADIDSPRIDILVLYIQILGKLGIEEPEFIEAIAKIANDAFSALGAELTARLTEDIKPALNNILSDAEQTIQERAERVIAALAIDPVHFRGLSSV